MPVTPQLKATKNAQGKIEVSEEPKLPKMNLPSAKKGNITKETVKPSAQVKPTLAYRLIPFGKITPNPDNAREDYGNLQPLIFEVVQNIAGIDPIRVFPADENGVFVIDRGHRRYRAINEAVKKGLLLKTISVPCIVDDTLTDEKQLIGQLSSNSSKRYTGIEIYRVIEKLAETHDGDKIATMIPSVSAKLIKFNYSLAKFYDQYLRNAVEMEMISLSCAAKLAYASDVADAKTGLWPELKKRLVQEYETLLKKIPEKDVFQWLDELRNGKEVERDLPTVEISAEIKSSISIALESGTIDKETLEWLMEKANVKLSDLADTSK